jgi:hypothetical protein
MILPVTQTNFSEQDVATALEQCRRSIAEFKRTRLLTEAALNGIVPYKGTPEQLVAAIQRARNPRQERIFAEEQRDFLRMLYRREPTPDEMRAGPPTLVELKQKLVSEGAVDDGMGFIWLFPVAAAIVGGAWGLSSIANMLGGQEQRAHEERELRSRESLLRSAGAFARTWAVPAVLTVGVGGLAWWWLFGRKSKAKKPAAAAAAPALPAAAPQAMRANWSRVNWGEEDEDEDEDDEPEVEVEEEPEIEEDEE